MRAWTASTGPRTPASLSSGWTSSLPGAAAGRLKIREAACGLAVSKEEHSWSCLHEYGEHRALRTAEARVDGPVRESQRRAAGAEALRRPRGPRHHGELQR